MIRSLIVAVLFLASCASLVAAQVRVQGYVRQDGTYVLPHVRSFPDGNLYNNFSQPRGLDPGVPLAGHTPTFHLPNLGEMMQQRQALELRQLEIQRRQLEEGAYRNRLYGR